MVKLEKGKRLLILALVLMLSLLSSCIKPITTSTPETTPGAKAAKEFPTPKSTPIVAPLPVKEVSLEEAAEFLEATVPLPKYLPPGYKLWRIFVRERRPYVYLLFSDEKIVGKVRVLPELYSLLDKVRQPEVSGGPKFWLFIEKVRKMPPPDLVEKLAKQAEGWGATRVDKSEVKGRLPANTVSVVDINQVKGYLSVGETSYDLGWFQSGFHFSIRMSKKLPAEELIKIAASIKINQGGFS